MRPKLTSKAKRFIFAGPLQHGGKVGGVVVLFESLVKDIDSDHIVLDTNGDNYPNRMCLVLNFLRHCLISVISKREISLHGTANDFKFFGIVLIFFNFFFGVAYNCRKFAGSFDTEFKSMPLFWQKVTATMLRRSRVNFFETHKLIDFFRHYNKETHWLPNYRSAAGYSSSETFSGRYVFIGHVKADKGIEQILALEALLPDTYSIDIFGPLIDYPADRFVGKVQYRGTIPPSDVAKTLAGYNVLVLPTYHDGEGYPGVIIEAYSVGLPVVTTDWLSLNEIVNDSCGVLVRPKDVDSLLAGMLAVEKNYQTMRDGAFQQFMHFDRKTVLPTYLSFLGLHE